MDVWLKKNNIKRYSTFGEHKSAVVERFNRTIKERMWKKFTAENTRNWIEMLNRLLLEYNTKYHTTIGMSPIEASEQQNYEEVLQNTLYKTNSNKKKKPVFKVGDKVRISRIKGLFEKGYLPNWSEEIFSILEVNDTLPTTYKLQDGSGEVLEGSFYTEELQKTQQEIYRIEKVVKKKKINGIEHALVKYSGYSDKFNEWLPIQNLEKIKIN